MPEDDFTEDERSTANLRLQSIPAHQRFMLGVLALVPRPWRGPLLIVIILASSFLATYYAPELWKWIQE